jgi:diguanylate cyclase
MSSLNAARPRRGLTLIRRIYLARIILLALGFISVGSVLYELRAPVHWWVLAAVESFLWPHIAFRIEMRAENRRHAAMRTLRVDNFLAGLWLSVMHFNLLPSVAIISMTAMSNAGIGGWKLLWRGEGMVGVGCAIGLLLVGVHWQPTSSVLNILSTLPLLVLYPIAIGLLTYELSKHLSQQRDKLDHLSKHDGLSGLLNRMHWETLVAEEFARGQRQRTPAAIILADIDYFKSINDRGGHAAGDEVIRKFADLMRSNVREIDRAARYGGEEFAVLMPGTTLSEAIEVAERLREILAHNEMRVTASFGVAELRPEFTSHNRWIECVDSALYRAKEAGRNCVVVYTPESVPIKQS